MKTHFTAEDIGKTFATSQEGVTATILEYDYDNTVYVEYSDSKKRIYAWTSGMAFDPYPDIYPHLESASEADLLRKEIEQLKASHEADLRTAVEMARGWTSWEDFLSTDEIIEKILKKL